MNLLALATHAALAAIVAAALEQLIAAGVRAVLLSARPLSGEHSDSRVYQRQLVTPGATDLAPAWLLLVAAGAAAAVGWNGGYPAAWALAIVLWLAALGWDLWTWERVAASVKFVTWRRGWRRSARRVPIARLREIHVVEKEAGPTWLPWRPKAAYLALLMRDGKAIKLPRTGAHFRGAVRVEELANFVRLQMQQVETTRKRVAAERRRERDPARNAMPPVHPSARPQTGL